MGCVVGLNVHAHRWVKEPHDTEWVLGTTRSNVISALQAIETLLGFYTSQTTMCQGHAFLRAQHE